MRGVLVLVLVSLPVIAIAGPDHQHPVIALRAGASTFTWHEDGSGNIHSGTGFLVDGEVGFRVRKNISIVPFAAYASARDANSGEDDCEWRDRNRDFDLGARLRFHLGGAFVGGGLGLSWMFQRGLFSCPGVIGSPSGGRDDHNSSGPILELHVGYTLPRMAFCKCAVQTFAAAQAASRDDIVLTARIAAGVAF